MNIKDKPITTFVLFTMVIVFSMLLFKNYSEPIPADQGYNTRSPEAGEVVIRGDSGSTGGGVGGDSNADTNNNFYWVGENGLGEGLYVIEIANPESASCSIHVFNSFSLLGAQITREYSYNYVGETYVTYVREQEDDKSWKASTLRGAAFTLFLKQEDAAIKVNGCAVRKAK